MVMKKNLCERDWLDSSPTCNSRGRCSNICRALSFVFYLVYRHTHSGLWSQVTAEGVVPVIGQVLLQRDGVKFFRLSPYILLLLIYIFYISLHYSCYTKSIESLL